MFDDASGLPAGCEAPRRPAAVQLSSPRHLLSFGVFFLFSRSLYEMQQSESVGFRAAEEPCRQFSASEITHVFPKKVHVFRCRGCCILFFKTSLEASKWKQSVQRPLPPRRAPPRLPPHAEGSILASHSTMMLQSRRGGGGGHPAQCVLRGEAGRKELDGVVRFQCSRGLMGGGDGSTTCFQQKA
ncbi:hypothetical protein I4F81_005480 [Pyropia yezoensis]|uniref:Uncharacterized protein n=1 Tax=Pyropia yezoensis TaxID=2788 RepID=A0ACC3BYJ2_PYRYE|nr:hypothetical protein I4F81_005480 [Neopyropia yezoensis]